MTLDQLLRASFPALEATSEELSQAEGVYRARIAASGRAVRPTGRWIASTAAVAAMIVVVVAVLAVRPDPVQATLAEIARAARTVDIVSLGSGEAYLTESTAVEATTIHLEDGSLLAYRITERRRAWVDVTGRMVIETTRTDPMFDTGADERTYFDSGLDEWDHLGETQITAAEGVVQKALELDWPTDADALLRFVRSQPQVSTDTDAADLLLALITESPAGPELRAATIGALGRLDLTVVEHGPDVFRFRTVPEAEDTQVQTFTLDAEGMLLRRTISTVDATGAETLTFDARYSPTELSRFP